MIMMPVGCRARVRGKQVAYPATAHRISLLLNFPWRTLCRLRTKPLCASIAAPSSLSLRMSSSGSRIVDLLMNPSAARHAAMPARHRRPAATALVAAAAAVAATVAAAVVAAAVAVAATAVAPVAAAAAVGALADPARCSRPRALPAARLLKFPLSRRATVRFIAVTASRPSARAADTKFAKPAGRPAAGETPACFLTS